MKLAVFLAGAFLAVAGLVFLSASGFFEGQALGILLEIAAVVAFAQIPRVGGPGRRLTRAGRDAGSRRAAAAEAESADEPTDEERLVESVKGSEPEFK